MPAVDEKRNENLRKSVKLWRGRVRYLCGRENVLRLLAGSCGIFCALWVCHAIYTLTSAPDPVLAVNLNQDLFKAPENVFEPQGIGLRGDADQEWLILPGPNEPVEIESNWYIPPITAPLEVPLNKLKRLDDHSSNYPGATERMQHGVYGKRPDGTPHSWESLLLVPLDREFPDYRKKECKKAPFYDPAVSSTLPAASVVFIFSNEPWETLMRSVHSVLNNTPPHLLYEIILVDDGSTFDEYTKDGNQQLVDYIKCCLPPKVKYTRTNTRAGITRARVTGINASQSDIFVILDSHVEAEPGWLEPLTYKINQDPTTFVMPMIDGIKKDHQYTPAGGGVGCSLGLIWKVMEHALVPEKGVSPNHRILDEPWGYITSPSMSGGLFAGHKQVFLDLGGYDLAMEGWGAENVEFGLRLWQCGAKLECSECSRVAHIFGRGQFYKQKGGEAVMNRLRTAGVWMDEFAVLPWIFNGQPDWKKMGDITEMMKIRKTLQCHNFKWFLENVWPESSIHDLIEDMPYHGPLTHVKSDSCVLNTNRSTKLTTHDKKCADVIYYSRTQNVASGQDDESFLTDLSFDWPRAHDKSQKFNVEVVTAGDAADIVRIVHLRSGKCFTLNSDTKGLVELVTCEEANDYQLWSWPKFNLSTKTYFSPDQF